MIVSVVERGRGRARLDERTRPRSSTGAGHHGCRPARSSAGVGAGTDAVEHRPGQALAVPNAARHTLAYVVAPAGRWGGWAAPALPRGTLPVVAEDARVEACIVCCVYPAFKTRSRTAPIV
jgi:hypothetical protein